MEICARCGVEKAVFGPAIKFTKFNGKLYCEECIGIVEDENVLEADNLTTATDSEKLMGAIKILDRMESKQIEQTQYLKTIKDILVTFLVFFMIGLVVQGCQAIIRF